MAVKLMRDNPADELRTRIGRLHKLLQRLVPAPDEWREAAAKNRDRIEPLACSSWEVCEAAWQDCLRWRQSLSDTLSVMLAVAASTSQTGNQLFLQVIAAAGSAKCLGKGTPILMFDGTIKSVEDVQVGDFVMGPDSCPREVLALGRGREQMYRVVPVKGDSYTVNESHILSMKMSNGGHDKSKSGRIVNMSLRQYTALTEANKKLFKGWRTAVEWEEQRTSIDPYFLGLWLGDGDSTGQAIASVDKEIRNYLNAYAFKLGLILVNNNKQADKTCPHLNITAQKGTSNLLLSELRKLGVIKNKHIPQHYKINSREVRLKLLAGLIDSDGTNSGEGFSYSSTIERLANDVAFLSRSLGFAAYISKAQTVCTNSKTKAVCTSWRVSISGDCSIVPVLLDRKRAKPRRQIKDVLRTGITVEKLGVDDYYGFTVTDDGLFVLGDFTVTHNTQLCDAMLVSQNCFGLEHLTGFHSGVVSDDGRDLSLLSRINHKTLITPEGDVLVASPMFQELMSQVRRIFDGKSGAVYKNTDEDKKWEGLRTPWILAGTPAMIDYWDQSRLGDRFLRVIVDTPVQDERRKIVLAAMNSEWEAVAERSSEASGGVESKMRRAYALTGGFVDWLRDNCHRIDEVTVTEEMIHKVADFAEFTADMRAKPNLDTRKLETHDSKEVPTRIGRQLIRLARCLALVMGKREVDADVMRRVRKVALDSAGGKTLDLLKWMHAVDPRSGKTYQDSGGIMASQLARWASFESESKCLAYLNFLLKIDVMEHVPCQHSHGHWRMTPRVESLQKSLR